MERFGGAVEPRLPCERMISKFFLNPDAVFLESSSCRLSFEASAAMKTFVTPAKAGVQLKNTGFPFARE